MSFPKITIITPVFNQVNFIEQAIRSVIDQGYPNLEYIVVDGGSTDGTMEIINRYSSWITKIISEPDSGMYDALNKGFRFSTGEIMGWINSDDMYHMKSFFSVAEIFQKFDDVEFLMGQKTKYDESGRCFITASLNNWGKMDYLKNHHNGGIQQESTFWRRRLWEDAGGFMSTKYQLAGDCELWSRFFMIGNAKLFMTNALIGGFRMRKGQLTENGKIYHQEVLELYSKIQISGKEKSNLKRLVFYENYLLKIPIFRNLFGWSKKYVALFDYAPFIKYDFLKNEFIKQK